MKVPMTFGPMGGGRPMGGGGPMGGGPMGGGPGRPGGGPMGGGGRPGMAAMIPGEKPKSFKRTMRALTHYLKPFRVAIILALLFSMASTVFAIIGPKMMGDFVFNRISHSLPAFFKTIAAL